MEREFRGAREGIRAQGTGLEGGVKESEQESVSAARHGPGLTLDALLAPAAALDVGPTEPPAVLLRLHQRQQQPLVPAHHGQGLMNPLDYYLLLNCFFSCVRSSLSSSLFFA